MTFSDELKKWRGSDLQKNACDVFGVPIDTYRKWEQGVNTPIGAALKYVRLVMAAKDAGVPVQQYIHNYQSVIKQVAAEIQNRK